MRLFKKLGLFAFMTFLTAGIMSTLGFSSPNKTTSEIENNVSTVAKAQHFFDKPKSAATLTPEAAQSVLDYDTKFEISKLSYSDKSVYVTGKFTNQTYDVFGLGYYDAENAENNKPAYLEVKVKDADGNVLPDVYTTTIDVTNKALPYVAEQFQGGELNIEVSIDIPYGTTVDTSSMYIRNLFYVIETAHYDDDGKLTGRTYDPQLDTALFKKGSARKSLQSTWFSSFASFTPKTITNYCGYYALAFDFNNVLTIEKYLEFNAIANPIFTQGANNKNVENLEKGLTYVSTRIVFTKNTTFFYVEDLDGDIFKVPATPANCLTTLGHNNVVFNIPTELDGKHIDGVKNFYIYKPMLTISVINKETNKEVASSSFSYRFGSVGCGIENISDANGNVVVAGQALTAIDSDLIAIILAVVISVVFIALCITMYFYRRNKYKNDEFKKVDTPAYIKTSIIAFLFFVVIGLDIYYLVMRCNALNNSELFANPVDIIVIVFTLVAFLLGCFFIKKYYIAFKETLEKNRREKLNLNVKTEEDSGTISAQFVKTETSTSEDTKVEENSTETNN